MKKLVRTLLPMMLLCLFSPFVHAVEVELTLKPEQELNRIDEKIYSHFLEHIYSSVNGGLWGEIVWNRSFENNGDGKWSQEDGVLIQSGTGADRRLTFGDANWTNYELTLEAKKTGGEEGFLILFRVQDKEVFSWANIGGWKNKHHALQRRPESQPRMEGAGPMIDGSVETNKWYPIKIRCEGNNVKVFLDGKQILDVTDDGFAKRGGVGVGTWDTQAQYRNIKVTSLDGQTVFYNDVPKLKSGNWEFAGGADMSLHDQNAINANFSVEIKSNGKPGTLSQNGFELKKDETYLASYWIKGQEAGRQVTMEFLDAKQNRIASFTSSSTESKNGWTKVIGEIKGVAQDTSNATMLLTVMGPGTYYVDQISIMPKSWAANGGFRPDLLQAVADLKPVMIRYPGGCYASAYRWKDGIGPQEDRKPFPISLWDDIDVNSYGTDEFIAMCRKVGAEPILVINVGTPGWNLNHTPATADVDWLQEALDWMEYCNGPATSKWGSVRAANGHPEPYNVKYWEIDNEVDPKWRAEYIDRIKTFVPAMKKVDPSIKIIACGSWAVRHDWDRAIIKEAGGYFDYISFHHYEWDPSNFVHGVGWINQYFHEIKEMIADSPNKNIKIFDSEWNAQSTDWRTGLYAGGLLNVFENCGDFVEIATPALFLRHVRAGGAWDNAFINFDNKSWFPAPNYVVMKLWRDHFAPIRIGLEGDTKSINMVATKSEDGKTFYIKAVNLTNEPRDVTINVPSGTSATFKRVTAKGLNDRNTLENPNAIEAKDAEVKLEGKTVKFHLPAYGVGVVTVK